MASLLSWLGGAAKRVENTINNDVIQPINRDVIQPINHNVVQPINHNVIQPAAQTVNRDVIRPAFGQPAIGARPNLISNARYGLQGVGHNFQVAYKDMNAVDNAVRNQASSLLVKPLRGTFDAGRLGVAKLTGNQVAAHNAITQLGKDYGPAQQIAQQWVTRPAAQISETLLHPLSGASYHPNSKAEQAIFGNRPVQNIQAGVQTNYRQHPSLPFPERVGLAGLYGAGQVAQDLPVGSAAAKTLGKAGKAIHETGQVGAAGKNIPKAGELGGKAPKSVPKPSESIFVPQTSTEGKIAKITSLGNRLNRLGGTGKDTLQTIRNKEVAQAMHTQTLKTAAKPFFDLPEDKQALAIKVQKGEATTTDASVQAGADSLRSMFKQAHGMVTGAGKDVGNLGENYFPRTYPKGWFDKPKNFNAAVQELVSSGKAPDLETAINRMNQIKMEHSINPTEFGNFLTREKDLPGGVENANTVSNYIKGASKSIAEAEHFGPNHEALNSLVAKAVQNSEDAGAIRNIISDYLHPARSTPGAVTTSLNAYQKALRVIQLPRAVVSHLPQSLANTASDIGYKNYFKAHLNDPAMDKLVENSGINADSLGKTSNVADKATAPGLQPLLSHYRVIAFRGGAYMARGLAKKGDVAGLRAIGVDGKLATDSSGKIQLTDLQLTKAGHFEANKSIGSHSVLESPAWIQTNGGKMVGMYRKMFTFKQAERIASYMRQAKNGNVAPLARYLAVGLPVSGLGVTLVKDEIKDPGSNPFSDPKKLALDSLGNSGGLSVGYGLAESAYSAATHNYGNDSRWANAASTISPGAGFAVQTGQNVDKAVRGKPAALEREGLRMSPVGGTYLANKLAPPTPYGVNSGNPALDKAVNDLKTADTKTKGQPGGKWQDYLTKEDATVAGLNAVQQQALIDQGTITQTDVTRANKLQATAQQQLKPAGDQHLPNTHPIDTTNLVGADAKFAQDYNRLSSTGQANFKSDPQNAYHFGQISYNQDSAKGTLTQAQDINRKEALATLKVKAMKDTGGNYLFSNDITTAYGLSKGEIADMLNSPGGQDLADKVVAYGDELVKAGAIAKNKWRDSKGRVSLTSSSGGSGGSRAAKGSRGGSSSGTKVAKTITSGFKTAGAMKAPKAPSIKIKSPKSATFKAPSAKKLAVSKIPSSYTHRKLG